MQLNKLGQRSDAIRRRVVAAGVVAVVGTLILPIALWAHAHLRRSEPAARAQLASAPSAIRLWFSERPELSFTSVHLRGADGTEISLGAIARMTDDAMGVWAPIAAKLETGAYTVTWRTAASDGHATTGQFTFDLVGAPKAAAVSSDTGARAATHAPLVQIDSTAQEPAKLNVTAATRWLEFVAMLAIIGAVVFRFVVLGLASRAMAGVLPSETSRELGDSARRLAQSALILLLIAAISRLYEEASAVLGPNRRIDTAALRTIVFDTRWGTGWLIGVAGMLVAAAGFSIAKRVQSSAGWLIAALGALGIAIAPALTGHASATEPLVVALGADILHVCAASAWIGGLLALLFASLPWLRGGRSEPTIGSGALVAGLVRAFHPVALTCAAIVILTGLVASWLRLPALSSLWESGYGRVLLVKLALVVIVAVLGALNWRRMLPALGDERAARRITRTAGAELTFAALVLAVTAILVSTPTPDRGARSVDRSAETPNP